ncbi:MAG TPA: GNAT family N-acetyltransferase [Propionibacteriaceae bacterium]|nr:GNAT family N-acetyltransferase [Propionibacteriaceae bacterium]
MRARRLRPLSVAGLRTLPAWDCHTSLLGPDADPSPAWARAAVERFGSCGVSAVDNEEVVGWVLYCPALMVPTQHQLGRGPRLADSAMLLGVAVRESHRGQGIGRQLMQTAAARVVGGASCIDALGAVAPLTCEVAPMHWLTRVGFAPVDGADAGVGPVRMRLDLGSTLRWRPDLRSAFDLLTGWVPRPGVAHEPAGRVFRRTRTH